MFANKSTEASKRQGVSRSSDIKAFLGPGSEFEGRMTFSETMRIDGVFRGEITSQDLLVIGETGQLKAEVTVGTMIICGDFQGTIKAQTSVQIKAPAKVKGEIICPRVSMEDGVMFDGFIQMSRQARSINPSPSLIDKTKKEGAAIIKERLKPPVEQSGNRTTRTFVQLLSC